MEISFWYYVITALKTVDFPPPEPSLEPKSKKGLEPNSAQKNTNKPFI